jgi:hypothetical protein
MGEHPGDPVRPVGVDRPDDPILTASQGMRDVYTMTALQTYCLTGYARSPIAVALNWRAEHPVPGDLVYVTDAVYSKDEDHRAKGLGYFLLGRMEPIMSAALWQADSAQWDGHDCPMEDVFYVQYGPAAVDVCRWHNASCRALPYTYEWGRQVQDNCEALVAEKEADDRRQAAALEKWKAGHPNWMSGDFARGGMLPPSA